MRFFLILFNLGCVAGRSLTQLELVDLVLEYIEGCDLLDFILTHDGLSKCMTEHITYQMCSALSVRSIPPSTLYGHFQL